MAVKNIIPKTFIVAETKIDENAIRNFLETIDEKSWQNRWLGDKSVSDCEKVSDLGLTFCKNVKSDVSSNEVVKAASNETLYTGTENSFLNHSQVSVLFYKVSFIFCKKILESKLPLTLNCQDINFDDMGFWYPPSFEILNELALGYGKTVEQYDVLKDYLVSKIEQLQSEDQEKKNIAIMDVARLFPLTVQTNLIVTTGLGHWMNCFKKFCHWDSDHELRLVFLNLASTFKKRYPTTFHKMFLSNRNGDLFGFDTLKENKDAWKEFSIIFQATN